MTIKVLISASPFGEFSQEPFKLLKDHKIEYELNELGREFKEEELLERLSKNNYFGIIAGTEPLTERVLTASAPTLKVISRVGVGIDNIALKKAKELGIKVFITPDAVTDAVAELTLGLILCALRRLNLHDRDLKNGLWRKRVGYLFKGKTLGIIGFGRIGRRVAELSRAFNVEVLFYDIANKGDVDIAKQVPLEYLLEHSDVVTIHVSGKSEVLSADKLAKVKRGAIIINTSRGAVINEDKLYELLKSGHVSYAGLDVFKVEPYYGRIRELENVILTPHIGSYTVETRVEMEVKAVKNLILGLKENLKTL